MGPIRRRPRWALIILLGMVLTVTLQLLSGFLFAMGDNSIYRFHVVDGFAAACFIGGEWIWLLGSTRGRQIATRIFMCSRESRHQLYQQLLCKSAGVAKMRDGLDAILEGLFLIFASITVVFGFLLWRGHGELLPWHRGLAVVLLCLWIFHLMFSIRDHWPRDRRGKRTSS